METKEINFTYSSSKEWYKVPALILPNVKYYIIRSINLVGYLYSMILDHDITVDIQVENPNINAPSSLVFSAGTNSVTTIKNTISSFTQTIPDATAIFTLNPLNDQQFSANFETTISYVIKDLKHVAYDIWFLKTAFGLNNPIMPTDVMVGDIVEWKLYANQMLRFLPASLEPTWELSLGWESSSFNTNGFNESDASAIPVRVSKVTNLVNNISEVIVNSSTVPTSDVVDIGVIKLIIADKSSRLKYTSDNLLNVNIVIDVFYKE